MWMPFGTFANIEKNRQNRQNPQGYSNWLKDDDININFLDVCILSKPLLLLPLCLHAWAPASPPMKTSLVDVFNIILPRVSAQSARSSDLIDLKIPRGAPQQRLLRTPPGRKSKNLAPSTCADWCLVLSYQVAAKSDKYCRLWIELKTRPYSAPWKGRKGKESRGHTLWSA